MTILRRILPRSWFIDIDYDRTEDIEFRDDYDPSEPRVPKGAPGGGEWTSGGGGGGGGAKVVGAGPVPQLTKYAGPAGKKMQQALIEHIQAGMAANDPKELAEQIKAESAKYKSSNVAGYLNQLLAHLAKHHGLPPTAYGKAVKKVEGEANDPPDTPPPSDEDMQKMAAAMPAAEPAGAMPGEPPAGAAHPSVATIKDITQNAKWSNEEKLAWVEALAGDIPDSDTASKQYANEQITALKSGASAPAAGAKLPWVEPAAAATPAAATPAAATPAPAPSGALIGLQEPVTNSQIKVANIANHPTMPTAEKLEKINAMVGNYGHPPNVEYAEHAISLLEDQQTKEKGAAPTGQPKEAEPTGPEPQTQLQKYLVAAAQETAGGSAAKLKAMQKLIDLYDLKADNASFKFAQQWANSLYGGAGGKLVESGTLPIEEAPAEEAPTVAPGIESKLATPSAFKPNQGEMWGFAADPNLSHEAKLAQIKHTIGQIFPPDDKDYGAKLLGQLESEQHALEVNLPQPPAGPGNAIKSMIYEIGYDPKLSHNDKLDKLNNEIQMASAESDKDYAKSLIAHLTGETPPEPSAAPVDLNKALSPQEHEQLKHDLPVPGGTQSEQDLWETAAMSGWTAAKKIKQLEADMGTNGIAQLGKSPISAQINAYAKTLVEHLKQWTPSAATSAAPAAATPAATSAPMPSPPVHVVNNPVVNNMIGLAKGGYTSAANLQSYLNNATVLGDIGENTDPHNYAKELIAWKQAKEGGGGTQAAPASLPPPPGGSITATAYQLATSTPDPANNLSKLQQYHQAKLANGTVNPGSLGDIYMTTLTKMLGGAPPTSAPKEKQQPPPTVNDPKPGSQTQNKMWTIAVDNPSGPGGKTNTEKIDAIKQVLAQSSGGAGGAAETYANHLITALGGKPTTVSEAQAAQPKPTPYSSTSSYSGSTYSTPSAPASPPKSYQSEINSTQYAKYKKNSPKPNPEEKSAVYAYTNGSYTEMNDALRKGYGLTPSLIKTIKDAQSFLARAKFPEDATLTRKISGDYAKELLGHLTKGAIFVDQGFASADHWSGDLTIKIKIKKGQKAAAVGHLSAHPSEKEIIIQKGSHFRVLDFSPSDKHITVELLDDNDPDIVI